MWVWTPQCGRTGVALNMCNMSQKSSPVILIRHVCCLLLCFGGMTAGDVFVSTKNGIVRGIRRNQSLQFLGIPYARPPIGEFRWRSPEPHVNWKPNIYDATTKPNACPQKYCTKYMPEISCPDKVSEDCLYLNVWTPSNATFQSKYPVMVYFHGGAFKFGHSSAEVYDGEHLASFGDVVVVIINYRLGLFGFLYTGDGPDDSHGNYGIQDQRTALQWVKDNILTFGGDPGKVTIFGQSAGGQSVDIHLMSPKSQGLFHRAIIQSAPFDVPYRTKSEALGVTNIIKLLTNCVLGGIKCLRSRSTEEIDNAQEQSMLTLTSSKVINYFEPIGPIIDNEDVLYQPMEGARMNKYGSVPILMGSVTEEVRYFVYAVLETLPLPYLLYESALAILRPDHFIDISKEYPPAGGESDFRDKLSQLGTDYMFTCSLRNVSQSITKANNQRLYRYVFDHATIHPGAWGNRTYCDGHVCHSADVPYVFGNLEAKAPTEDERRLSRSMVTYWTNFAHTGDPNHGPTPSSVQWPIYDPDKTSTMYFETAKNKLVLDYRREYCDFWDSMDYDN